MRRKHPNNEEFLSGSEILRYHLELDAEGKENVVLLAELLNAVQRWHPIVFPLPSHAPCTGT